MTGPTSAGDVVLPDYDGACIASVAAVLLDRADEVPAWMPRVVADAAQIVLLVLDGLGWEQLMTRPSLAPTLHAMSGAPITSVVPSTTATALTSLTTGRPPGEHGIMGYRMHAGDGEVLNVLRWTTAAGDARTTHPPRELQRCEPFGGRGVPVVTRAEFANTGFTTAHLGSRLVGWRMPSSMPVEIRRLLAEGEQFVYAYYDGIDKIAHEHGLDEHFDAEMVATDRLVADIVAALPRGAALVLTSDHGQVDVSTSTEVIDPGLAAEAAFLSGEARFRWFHADRGNGGDGERLAEQVRDRYGDVALVRTLSEVEAAGWFGPRIEPAVRARLGDVALLATGTTAYLDPTDPGEPALRSRHGGLTRAEMLVPLLAYLS